MTENDAAALTVDEVAGALSIGLTIRVPRVWLDRMLAGKLEDGDE